MCGLHTLLAPKSHICCPSPIPLEQFTKAILRFICPKIELQFSFQLSFCLLQNKRVKQLLQSHGMSNKSRLSYLQINKYLLTRTNQRVFKNEHYIYYLFFCNSSLVLLVGDKLCLRNHRQFFFNRMYADNQFISQLTYIIITTLKYCLKAFNLVENLWEVKIVFSYTVHSFRRMLL